MAEKEKRVIRKGEVIKQAYANLITDILKEFDLFQDREEFKVYLINRLSNYTMEIADIYHKDHLKDLQWVAEKINKHDEIVSKTCPKGE